MSIGLSTATAYYAQLPSDRGDALLRVRARILQLWPAIKEDMSYGMPTYVLDGKPLFALASQKHYLVFYAIPYDLLEAFKHELVMYNRGKSCIRLRQLDDTALVLLDRIVRFIGATHAESRLRLKPMVRSSATKAARPSPSLAAEAGGTMTVPSDEALSARTEA